MKVCFIFHSSRLGGAEACTMEALEGLKKANVECLVILPQPGPIEQKLDDFKVTHCVIPYTWWLGDGKSWLDRLRALARNLVAVVQIYLQIRRWHCDIVYTNTITVPSGAVAAWLLRLPHVWHLYEFGLEDHNLVYDFGKRPSLWLMNRLSDRCIAVSKAIERYYAPYIQPQKLKQIYFAVNEPKERAPRVEPEFSEGALKCIIVGRVHESKGQDQAIRAIGELRRRGIRASLAILGNGAKAELDKFKELSKELNIADSVQFRGDVGNVMDWLKAADVILVCSRCEALGRAAVEAMYAGRPVVAARTGGTPEMIRDGFNGLLYEPGDAASMADKISQFINRAEFGHKLGENGMAWAREQYSTERLGRDLVGVFEPLLAN